VEALTFFPARIFDSLKGDFSTLQAVKRKSAETIMSESFIVFPL
jgi:hypothetical protein